jgi:hypothetical protein
MATPRVYHWRRHRELVVADACFSGLLAGKTIHASACGRLVDYQEMTGDPEETDCPECQVVAAALAKLGQPPAP